VNAPVCATDHTTEWLCATDTSKIGDDAIRSLGEERVRTNKDAKQAATSARWIIALLPVEWG